MVSLRKPLIYDLELPAVRDLFNQLTEPAYRADQVWKGIYKNLWASPQEFTDLPKTLRLQLGDHFEFRGLNPVTVQTSRDRMTEKTVFELHDLRLVETVWMQYEERNTLCISTQSGCAMGCVFCATGQMGFKRHLTSGEIVEQVLYYARKLASLGLNITNIVVMGMGEPFHNYDATLAAIDRLGDPLGMNLGARRFTISTVGLVPIIRKFAEEKRQINLAISLHAANNELRSKLLPINRKYPLEELQKVCTEYVTLTNRRLTFEWALIRDVNDTVDDAEELSRWLQGLLCHVNIIPLNPTKKYPGQPTTHDRAKAFQSVLQGHGIPCTIRLRRGIDIEAGCGQLAGSIEPQVIVPEAKEA